MKGSRLFTKDFCLGFLISACCSLCYFAILINITEFAMGKFGCSEAEAGLSAGVYVIGGLVSRLFLGKYIELIGRKRMLIASELTALAISALYFQVSSMEMLYAVRFFHGMAYGISSSSITDIIAKILPRERLGEGMGYFSLSITIATAVGPYLGLMLSPDYDAVFTLVLVMYSIAAVCALLMRVPEETLTDEQKHDARSFRLDNLLQISAIPLGITSMVFFFGYSGILTFIDSYTENIGFVELGTYFYMTVSVGTLISRLTTGRIFDRRGPNLIITLAFLMFIGGMTVFSRTDVPWMFMASGFFMGYGMSIVYAVCQASALSVSPSHRYGVTTSTFAMITDIGTGLGPMCLGLLIQSVGFRDMYLFCAGLGLVSMALYWIVHGRLHIHDE